MGGPRTVNVNCLLLPRKPMGNRVGIPGDSGSGRTSTWPRPNLPVPAHRVVRVRLVIAQCTVDYVGRLTAHLPSSRRLLLFKADGSVSVHADDRAYKPLNWMSPPCWLIEELDGPVPVWVVENKAGEQLRITVEDIEHDSSH